MPERTEDPDQATIELGCLEAQARWTETQRLSRAVGPVAGWLPPVLPATVLTGAEELGEHVA